MSRVRACAAAFFCILSAATLQGCLLTRVLETRAQLCDEQPARVTVVRRHGSGLRVVFEKPTLTDRDVVWLVGYEPTSTADGIAAREFFYEALPLDRPLDHAGGLVVRLSFVRVDGEYRLSEVEIPEKFNSILSLPLLDAAVRIVCKTNFGVGPPSTTFDLTSLDLATLPNRDALIHILGAPTSASSRPDEASYRYCLAPCDSSSSMVASLSFLFGSNGGLSQANVKYFRYAVVIDLNSYTATANLQLY